MKLNFSTIWNFVSFLIQPEDSITGSAGEHEEYPGKQRKFAGIIKAIFWMVIAIASGLMISKL